MNCPVPEVCGMIDQFLKSGEKELPPFLRREIDIIIESPTDFAHIQECKILNLHFCHLIRRSQYGSHPAIEVLLKLLEP